MVHGSEIIGQKFNSDHLRNFGLYRVHDLEDEFRRVSMLVKKGILKKEV